MGFFSRKKTILSATTASMVTDSPDIVQQSVLTSIAHGTDITADLVINLQNSTAAYMQKYYSAGKYRKDKGMFNLFPASHNSIFSTKVLDIEYTLNAIHGELTKVVTFTYQPLDTDMMAYEYMAATYGFNIVDYTFTSSPSGDPVNEVTFVSSYLVNGILVIRYGNSTDEEGEETYYTETTPVTGLNTADVYYHVVYVLVSNPNQYLYWNYPVALNTYDYLTQNEYKYDEGYYPVVPIIEYSQNMTDEALKATPQYEASRATLKSAGLDFVQIHESLLESESYDAIEQAHFACAVRLQDDDPLALKYMFTFFKSLYSTQKYNEQTYTDWGVANAAHIAPPVNSLNYRMTAFKIDLRWNYITSKIVNKTWTHGELEHKRFHTVKDPKSIIYYNDEGEPIDLGQTYDVSTITYVRKIDENTQEEVTIVGMAQINYIDNVYSVEWDVSQMFQPEEDGEDPVSFLVQPDVVKKVFPKLLERNTFYFRTYTLVLNFKQVVKLKWYQTGLFQFIMIVVGIVITVWSAGTLSQGIAAAYGAAGGGAAGIAAATGQALLYAGMSAVTSWAFTELIKEYGLGVAAIVAVVLVVMTGFSHESIGYVPSGQAVSNFAMDILKSFETFFQESSQDLMAEAKQSLDEYTQWKDSYDEMYSEMFDLGDSFAEIYAEYTQEKSVYNSMTPDEYMFVAMDMILMSPHIVTGATETYIDNELSTDTFSA